MTTEEGGESEAAATAAPAAETPAAAAPREQFRFTGDAREYFRIWIVNLFLTLVTLGIYSAWAKVRKKRYLYGNTWLAGCNFDYHGDAVAILKGRLLAFAAFMTYSFATNFSPRAAAIVLLVLMPVVPWLVLRSFAFNARNSSHRNLRFHFAGSYRAAFLAIVPVFAIPASTLMAPQFNPFDVNVGWKSVLPLFLGPLVALAFYPWIVGSLRRLLVNGTRFGTAPFASTARIRRFYFIYFIAMLLAIAVGMAFGIAASVAMVQGAMYLGPAIGMVGYAMIGVLAFGFTQARVANLVFNTTTIGAAATMKSELRSRRLMALYAGNLVAILLSAGMAIPWAAMRVARYRAESLSVDAADLEGFLAGFSEDVAATGEEVANMFDVDISL